MESHQKMLGEYERAPAGILELWERVQVEWGKIGLEVCQNIIESMSRRVSGVVKERGGHTKYWNIISSAHMMRAKNCSNGTLLQNIEYLIL